MIPLYNPIIVTPAKILVFPSNSIHSLDWISNLYNRLKMALGKKETYWQLIFPTKIVKNS